MADEHRSTGRAAFDEVVCTAAGLADLLIGQAKQTVKVAGRLVRRSDLSELMQTGRADLKARGKLLLHRCEAGPGPPHLEVLAKRVARAASTDA
jgi:hypothetical protein